MGYERRTGFEVESDIKKFGSPESFVMPTIPRGTRKRGDDDLLTEVNLRSVGFETIYTNWSHFEIISEPFDEFGLLVPLLTDACAVICDEVPYKFLPWSEQIIDFVGPPMRFDRVEISPDICEVIPVSLDVSIEVALGELGLSPRLLSVSQEYWISKLNLPDTSLVSALEDSMSGSSPTTSLRYIDHAWVVHANFNVEMDRITRGDLPEVARAYGERVRQYLSPS